MALIVFRSQKGTILFTRPPLCCHGSGALRGGGAYSTLDREGIVAVPRPTDSPSTYASTQHSWCRCRRIFKAARQTVKVS